MSTTLNISGITVDISRVTTDGRRWYGKIEFTRDGSTVEGTWIGALCSDMGEICDVEGEYEALCEAVETMACGEIFAALGDPSDREARRERAMEQETEWAIREAMGC